MKNINIIFVVTEDWYFVSHRLHIAEYLIKNGYNVSLITKVSTFGKTIEDTGIKLINIDWSRNDKNPIKIIKNIRFIRNKLKDYEASILHSVALKPIFISYFVSFRLSNIINVNAISGLGFLVSTQGIKSKITQFLLKNGLKLILKKHAYVIVQNQSDYKYILNNKIIQEANLKLIKGVGVPLQIENQISTKDMYTILFAGRMLWSKGIKEVVATAKLFDLENDINVKFVLAGKPDEDNPESIPLSYLENLNLSNNIVWQNHISDLSDIYENTDIFLFPTKYGEGIPKVLLEATSFGVPVICSDNPGCKEIIHNGKNGIILSSLEPKVIKEEILSLLQNLEKRKKMSTYSKILVASEFSDRIIHNQMLDLHKNLFGKLN